MKSLKARLLGHDGLKVLLSTDSRNNMVKFGDNKDMLVMMKEVEQFSAEVGHLEKLLGKLKSMHEVVLS